MVRGRTNVAGRRARPGRRVAVVMAAAGVLCLGAAAGLAAPWEGIPGAAFLTDLAGPTLVPVSPPAVSPTRGR